MFYHQSDSFQDSHPGPSPGTEHGPVSVQSLGQDKTCSQSQSRWCDWKYLGPGPNRDNGTINWILNILDLAILDLVILDLVFLD